jgi:SP family xylose:H+ symportor-like MFS transporter
MKTDEIGLPGGNTGSLSYLVLICLIATLGGLLFGYDTAVISGAIGFLQTHFQLDAAMKGWAASSALAGCVLGVTIAGVLGDLFGRRNLLIVAALLFLASAIGTAIPRTFGQFVFFRIIGGLGVGTASMASPLYIAEISPAAIRGRMVSINQFAIVSGMLVVYFVNYFIASLGDVEWNVSTGWRWMFGSGVLPSVLLLCSLFFVPESPRFLAKQGRWEAAQSVLARIGGPEHARRELQEIETTIAEASAGILQLANPRILGVLMVGVALAVLQQVTGINVFLYFAPEIFTRIAGSGMDAALLQTVVVGGVNLLFTVIAIWTVDLLGRKPLMLIGYSGMALALIGLGTAAYFEQTKMWVLLFMLGYIACFALAVGPVTWVILSEIFPMRIRGSAMSVATFCLWVANFVVSQTFPMLDDDPWLIRTFHHAFPFWLYAIFCLISIMVVALFVPETKGKSLEAIERMWHGHSEANDLPLK